METHLISSDPTAKIAITQSGVPLGYQQATISTTAVGLPSIPASSDKAIITIETQGDVRWRDDNIAPTAAVGMYLFAGSTLVLENAKSISQFKVIRQGTVDVVLNVSYYIKA